MKHSILLLLFFTVFCWHSPPTYSQDPEDPKVADIVFVVDLEYPNEDFNLQLDPFFWLCGSYTTEDGGQPVLDSNGYPVFPGVIRRLDERLRELGVNARYGLTYFDSDRVAYVSFGPSDSEPNPDHLWVTSNQIDKLEKKLIERWVNKQFIPNADGDRGQDAIMRVLGLQVIPGEEVPDGDDGPGPGNQNGDQQENFGIDPAYNFRPGAKSIVFITGRDTDVGTGNFEIETPTGSVIEVPDFYRRHIFRQWTLDELEENEIIVHTITPSLFAADVGVTIPSANRDKFITKTGRDDWIADDESIKNDTKNRVATDPLFFFLGETTNAGSEEYESQLLAKNLYGTGDREIDRNGWSIKARIKRSDPNAETGKAIFLFGGDNDQPNDSDPYGSPAAIEIEFARYLDTERLRFSNATLMKNFYGGIQEPKLKLSGGSPGVPYPSEWLEVEIRAVNTFRGDRNYESEIQLIINDICVGHWDAFPKVQSLNHLAISADSFEGAAFDNFEFFVRLNHGEVVKLRCDGTRGTPHNFFDTHLPFKQFFCNDFGFEDGAQYDFDIFGLAWQETVDECNEVVVVPNAYIPNLWPTTEFPNVYRTSRNGKHVYSADYQDINYFKLAESTLGSAWSVVHINEMPKEQLDEGFTPAFVNAVADSISGESKVEPAPIDILINGGDEQRSMVFNVEVKFPGIVDCVDSSSFLLVNKTTGEEIIPDFDFTVVDDQTIANLTFPRKRFYGESLADGIYELTSLIFMPEEDITIELDARTHEFHRFFGDADADRTVSIFEFLSFRNYYSGPAGELFDANRDGWINAIDLLHFRANYGKSLD